jgi:L-ascorbate metabolism protein UlaG (beta-lactamase superfamily)
MKVTYLGHSSFLIEIGGKNVLFDPYISPNPAASEIKAEEIQADYILVTHAHGDHIADVESIAKRCNSMIIANAEVGAYYSKKGIENVHMMNSGGNANVEFGRVKMVTAIHSSSFPDGTYGGNPNGFVIQAAEGTFYYAGDTALTYDMKLIADEFKIGFAFLPIGDTFTMNINDAMRAAEFVGTTRVIGMHYDTFPPIAIDKLAAHMTAKTANIELTLMEIGQTIDL